MNEGERPVTAVVCTAYRCVSSGGRIVFVSSALTHVSNILPIALLFAATKGAIEQIVRVFAKDLGERGITVNAIAPGPVNTPLFRAGKSPAFMKSVEMLYPQQRLPQPDEISPLVAFLSSKDGRWINGQTLGINGVSLVLTKFGPSPHLPTGFRGIAPYLQALRSLCFTAPPLYTLPSESYTLFPLSASSHTALQFSSRCP